MVRDDWGWVTGIMAQILTKNVTILPGIPRILNDKTMKESLHVIKEMLPYFVNTPAANPK